MTLEEIKAKTISLSNGRIVPRTDGTWHLWFTEPLRHGGTHPDQEAALIAYNKEFPDDVCLNCGS